MHEITIGFLVCGTNVLRVKKKLPELFPIQGLMRVMFAGTRIDPRSLGPLK